MAFEKTVPVWNAPGAEPPETLKNTGFQTGYKPPADYFNWFWHGVSQCLLELQEKANEVPEDTGPAEPTTHAETHAKDGSDPISPADIGAAPSGYGYGEQMAEVTSPDGEAYNDYCAKVDAILAGMDNRQTMQINIAPPNSEDALFGACAATLYKGTDAYASLTTIGHSNKYAYGWRMQKRAGAWEPFEWIDPPMNVGVVYRTTERYNGNAVYKKLGSDGTLYWSTDNATWNTYLGQLGVTWSMTDITAGASSLATGKMYLVYE